MTFTRDLLGSVLTALLIAGGAIVVTSGLLAAVSPVAGYVPPSAQLASPEPSATPSGSFDPSKSPGPSPEATPAVAVATRVVVPALRIDLPVVSQTYGPGHGAYPLCDVAQYLKEFKQPSEQGTTYLYGHARDGMFGPLLTQWQRDHGKKMVGDLVLVYTKDDKRYLYGIFTAEAATDFSLARSVPAGESWLILQTSTGPNPTFPRLMVAARLIEVTDVSHAEANPTPHARDCS
jgi:hypothetical protein